MEPMPRKAAGLQARFRGPMSKLSILRPLLRAGVVIGLACPLAGAWAQAFGNQTDAQAFGSFIDSNGAHPDVQDCIHVPANCGPGPRSAAAYYTTSSGEALQGSTAGTVTAQTPLPPARGDGTGTLDSWWWDSFTVQSASLPVGTPVNIVVTIHMLASVTLPSSTAADSSYAVAALGPAFVSIAPGYSLDDSASFSALVGSSFDLVGRMRLKTETLFLTPGDFGQIEASARYFVGVSGAEATLSSASGHDYAAPVPEPQTWALMLAGAAVLAWTRQPMATRRPNAAHSSRFA